MSDDYVTAATAADVLQVSHMAISRLCTQGKLDGIKQSGSWRITRASVDERAALMARKSSSRVPDSIITGTVAEGNRNKKRTMSGKTISSKTLCVRIPIELFRQLDIAARAAGLTPSDFTRAALVTQLQQNRPPAMPDLEAIFADSGRGLFTARDLNLEGNNIMNPSDYVTVATAADELHCNRSTVTRLLTQKKLDGVKQFGSWFVTRASLDARLELVAKKSSPLVADAIINGTASQDNRPQVRVPRRRAMIEDERRREACERQIATATTYTYIDRDGNRQVKERER